MREFLRALVPNIVEGPKEAPVSTRHLVGQPITQNWHDTSQIQSITRTNRALESLTSIFCYILERRAHTYK
jgi:hypothetical protein